MKVLVATFSILSTLLMSAGSSADAESFYKASEACISGVKKEKLTK